MGWIILAFYPVQCKDAAALLFSCITIASIQNCKMFEESLTKKQNALSLSAPLLYIRAGELAEKICQGVQPRHMGLKNVPKKFGTPGPNLAPNLFGLFGQGQITKAGTPK